MKTVAIPLVTFARPVPRTGSIEAHSGYGRAASEGQEIHARVQRKRAKRDPRYQAEVPVRWVMERDGYAFQIEGRMDGLFRHDPPRIEEIKSGFNILDYGRRLADHPLAHPYGLQLLSYGYWYVLEHQVQPRLSFHLVSLRTGECRDVDLQLDLPLYEQWLDTRLDELVIEARQAEKRAARRRRIAKSFIFPFSKPRPGQTELMGEIEEGIGDGRPVLIQAPTGLGKTVGVLYPVLREALGRGQKVLYVTPKNSQHEVAEDAVRRFQENGARLKSLSITAKAKICLKNEPLCTPEYCEYARDYYAKLQGHEIPEILARKRSLKARAFRELGEKYEVCPFELQLEAVREADVVICDYNYVFAPRSALNRVIDLRIDQTGKPNLVVDEVHNLPTRAMDAYSPALSSLSLELMREEVDALPARFRNEAIKLLDSCIQAVTSCGKGQEGGPRRINPPGKRFLEQDGRLRAFLSHYLDSDVEIAHRDVVLRMCHYWSEFTENLQYLDDPRRDEFFTTYQPHATGGTVKITCCDASAMLKDCYGEFDRVVGFSATLKPFDYYVQLCGLSEANVRTAEFETPFPSSQRKLLIIPQISTKYRRREQSYGKVAETIARIAELRRGNYFVFFPSFGFLERVAELFQPPTGFSLVTQERNMKRCEVKDIVDSLREQANPTIIFAVQGGSFSEGMDYAGEMVIGAFVVGPPLPIYNLERELMRDFYQRRYNAGFDFAYVIPAMAKAIQAAGRVIRSETDRGLIVLMDSRFTEPEYSRAMPTDWFESDVRELVSSSILSDVTEFWAASIPD